MEVTNESVILDEGEFVEEIIIDMVDVDENAIDMYIDDVEEIPIQHQQNVGKLNDESQKALKPKRRGNLTEFGNSTTTKRKNESAKRELTSVVNQVRLFSTSLVNCSSYSKSYCFQLKKIDKQLNTKDDKSRVAINFVATFTSFKSERVNTFKYPLDADTKKTFIDYDTTIAAVKAAVQEAVRDVHKDVPSKDPVVDLIGSSNTSDALATPTKMIAAFTALPSPVTVKGQPISAKNLCAKNSCSFGKKLRKHVWIKCSHRNAEEQGCSYWVHAPCIGFPSLKAENSSMLDGWCCPEHTDVLMKKK